MPRATNAVASRRRRKKIIAAASGFRGRRSKLFRYAKDAIYKARYWAYRDRKTRKRNFRTLWDSAYQRRLPHQRPDLQPASWKASGPPASRSTAK